jgi:hypothetical protein
LWWRRMARQAMTKGEPVGFAPVLVGGASKAKRRDIEPTITTTADRHEAVIEIVLGPALVRVSNGADVGTLSAVVAAIKALAV